MSRTVDPCPSTAEGRCDTRQVKDQTGRDFGLAGRISQSQTITSTTATNTVTTSSVTNSISGAAGTLSGFQSRALLNNPDSMGYSTGLQSQLYRGRGFEALLANSVDMNQLNLSASTINSSFDPNQRSNMPPFNRFVYPPPSSE